MQLTVLLVFYDEIEIKSLCAVLTMHLLMAIHHSAQIHMDSKWVQSRADFITEPTQQVLDFKQKWD